MVAKRAVGLGMGGLVVLLFAAACEPAPCKDDGNACTIDCVAGKALHEGMPEGSSCKVGSKAGTCAAGYCVVDCAKDGDCFDGDPCTADKCAGGACTNAYGNGVYFGADDPNDCVKLACVAGQATQIPAPDGAACGSVGACDHGVCDECLTDADCGKETACDTRKCSKGACVVSAFPPGTQIADPVKYDCRALVCDGQGNVDVVAYEADVPLPNATSCIEQTCSGWTAVFGPKPPGTKCLDSAGTWGVCDGVGTCVACVKDTDCASWDEYCFAGQCSRCNDMTQNGDETGVDCGNAECGLCKGDTCTMAAQCKTGSCEDGVCCDLSCGLCMTCKAEGAAGTCTAIPQDYKDPTGCTATNKACNGGGVCKTKNGYACSNGVECISNKCTGGLCLP